MPVWLTIVLALGGSALISAVIGIVVKRIETSADKKKEQNNKYKEEHERHKEEQKFEDFRSELITEIKTEIKDVVNPLVTKIDKVADRLEEDRDATILTLRCKMKTLRDQYKEQGFAEASDKATWNELYDKYKQMGGNHFKEYVNQWKDEVKALPINPPKDKPESTKKYVHD